MSNIQIYLARNNVQAGPYSLEQVNTMLASGEVELTDLMWHEGMDNWQRVGIMTSETRRYTPLSALKSDNKIGSMVHNPTVDPSLNNTTKATDANRTTIDRLYGKTTSNTAPSNTSTDANKTNNRSLTKKGDLSTSKSIGNNQLAEVGVRFLASLIDYTLIVACFIPFFAALGFSFEGLSAIIANYTTFEAYSTQMQTYLQSLPSHLLVMTDMMLIALFVIQTVMLLKRGQSIGKLATGLRILNINTHQVPNATSLILIRAILTNLAYSLGFIGFIIALADFTVLIFDKQRRSLHDKLAKTYVVKADDRQLAYKNKQDTKTIDKK